MTDLKNILHGNNLSIGYKSSNQDIVIAKNLNLHLKNGEMVCVLGKNGIGKSTLLRTLTKVQPQLTGEIILNDHHLEKYNSMDLSKCISLVLTEKIPPSNLTVYELIALGRQPYTNWLGTLTHEDKNQINFAIQKTNLKELIGKRCDELSDGQLQRVMICRALAQNTQIIILDEPTAHLDIQHKMETFKLLQGLAHDLKKTILISSHEIQLALQMADRLWLMSPDKLIDGKPKTLIEENQMDQLFDRKNIHFDKNTYQFLID